MIIMIKIKIMVIITIIMIIMIIIMMMIISVRPIVRTSRTAFVCASDYDDRTQFHMFEQKNEHG